MASLVKFGWWVGLLGALIAFFPCPAAATDDTETDWEFGGYGKFRYIHTRVPGDSIFHAGSGSSLEDYSFETRLKASARRGDWDFSTDAQVIGVHSETLLASRQLPLAIFPRAGIINDDRRWFNLSHVFTNEGTNAALVRLDRLSVGYSGERAVVRFGRQAISWGNGLLYTPMDIFNPFDPTLVDKEYKSGDDMLYGQYLFTDGSDMQAVAMVRRNPVSGEVESDQSSVAIKYNGLSGGFEYDLLLSRHYADFIFGLGGSADIGGVLWRGDLLLTETDRQNVVTGVGGASYSWVSGSHNWTAALEYYFNGFGQSGGDYSTPGLAGNPNLLRRLARGEVFNLGRHYFGLATRVEVTPLLNLSPNLFVNLTDPSALAQLVLSYDWKQDWQVLAAVNVPLGPKGGEFGGIEAPQTGLYIATGASLFAQLAWYF